MLSIKLEHALNSSCNQFAFCGWFRVILPLNYKSINFTSKLNVSMVRGGSYIKQVKNVNAYICLSLQKNSPLLRL